MARTPTSKETPATEAARAVREIPVPAHFNKVFFTTAGLTILCLLISLLLATTGKDGPATREVVSSCLTMAKLGFGAIIGLIGGKAL